MNVVNTTPSFVDPGPPAHTLGQNYLDATLNARDDRWNADVTMGLKKPKASPSNNSASRY